MFLGPEATAGQHKRLIGLVRFEKLRLSEAIALAVVMDGDVADAVAVRGAGVLVSLLETSVRVDGATSYHVCTFSTWL